MAAEKYFTGAVVAVAQVDTVQITADDAATTYTITIGGVTVSVSGTGTGVNDTATALAAALEAATHPYFTAITYTAATDTVTLTANVAGCPFTAASSVAGGAGTIGAVTSSTACTGPNYLDAAGNWDNGVAPEAGDTLHIDTDTHICWGVDISAVAVAAFYQYRNTGCIGLRHDRFATSANGQTVSDPVYPEYRDHYAKIHTTLAVLGRHNGTGSPNGSPRIKIDFNTTAATVQIENAGPASETGEASIRLKMNCVTTDVFVRSATGGLGIATDAHDETSSMRTLSISDTGTGTRVSTGDGLTLINWQQRGGTNLGQFAATITLVDVDGGVLTTEGNFTATTVNVAAGATYNQNHIKTAAAAITTLNNRGTVDATKTNQARTWTTFNPWAGSALTLDKDVLTITTGSPCIQDTGPQTINY